MEQIVNLVAEKAGISQAQAQTAVKTVTDFLKDKLPAGMNLDSLMSGKGVGNLTDSLGGMFGKK
jgi:nucleoid DNA-binding protein